MLRRRLKYYLIKFLRLKGAPGKIALGFAVGACVNFFPTFGIGLPFAGLMAGMVTASIPAGLLGDLFFKPLFPLFFYLNLITGYFFWSDRAYNIKRLTKFLIHHKAAAFGAMGKAFFTGAIINSLILGTILYLIVYFIIERYRMQLLKWLLHKSRRN